MRFSYPIISSRINPSIGIGQGQRKTLDRVGFEPTTFQAESPLLHRLSYKARTGAGRGYVKSYTFHNICGNYYFVEDVMELHLSTWCTCSTIIFLHSTNEILSLWLCRCLIEKNVQGVQNACFLLSNMQIRGILVVFVVFDT